MRSAVDPDLRLTLSEHLTELRARLLKCVVSVLVLGVAALAFAKPIFGILMKPVLDALPPDSRSLVFTSGIEEINVLMKVGLYAGIFLTTPVILWQLWSFVSPGLYENEKRFAAPFVFLGTLAFLVGAVFCYLVLLPTMFKFLLREGDAASIEHKLETARVHEAEALRWLRLGEVPQAGKLAASAAPELALAAPAQGWIPNPQLDPTIDVRTRIEGLGRLLDATAEGLPAQRPVLRNVMDTRAIALAAFARGDLPAATKALDDAAGQLAAVSQPHAAEFAALWRLEKELAGKTTLFKAHAWTRPMLTMHEQLSLVLLLELAFGIIFELPLVMALLGVVGLVSSSFLMRYQRHAVVFCMVAAAIITPTGDAVNLALMAGPMMLCYEVGVLAVWLIEKRRKPAEDADADLAT